MGLLIDQFAEAVREWSRRTGVPEYGMPELVDWEIFLPPWFRSPPGPGGPYNFDAMRRQLETLAERSDLREDFLVPATIRAIDKRLESSSEDSSATDVREARARARARAERDPDASDWRRALGEPPSLEDLRSRRRELDVWRELTAPILDKENLKRYSRDVDRRP